MPTAGVDTKVDAGSLGDETGYLRDKTVWQYKAGEYAGFSKSRRRAEITKPFVKRCIEDGYAYRFCICDNMPAETKQIWEEDFTRFAREMNPFSPEARVVTADDVAAWVRRSPALVAQLFDPSLLEHALHLRAWGRSITDLTPSYVTVGERRVVEGRVVNHVRLSSRPAEAVLTLQGEAGVGKTRLIYEAIAALREIDSLVLYTDNDRYAEDVARRFANDDVVVAVLIADECPVDARVRINDILRGHRGRVRVGRDRQQREVLGRRPRARPEAPERGRRGGGPGG